MPDIKNYYAIPGVSPETYTERVLSDLIGMIEYHYRLPAGAIQSKKETGKPEKKCGTVSLVEIKKAIILLVHQSLGMSVSEFCRFLSVDRSCFYLFRDTSKNLYEVKDEVFMRYYNEIRLLATGERIRDIPVQ